MNLNEITAGIELLGNNINKLVIKNSLVNFADAKEKKIDFCINKPRFEKDDDGLMGQIEIEFKIDLINSEEQKCHMEIALEGAFVPSGDIDEEQFEQLVMVNGAAALVSIARGKIEAISGNVLNSGKIVIPFINVLEYYKEASMK
ncbi:hypothetical protein NXH64_04590 [Butyrivibrio fibrisolvens]|uniref:hypothetical protein n=1 Tax=Pseudobutyrivibrio ruminis TaxID=46206 RepID=UPI000414C2A0|nr:hypothetical protein [Pseudobutyrivibrio ruminis]MDC7278778.1 hypothetical protein [Butyrivibrio fibrisolvens]